MAAVLENKISYRRWTIGSTMKVPEGGVQWMANLQVGSFVLFLA